MILTETSQPGYLPKRIISLVPSQTELLFDLGLDNETAGITKFCVHPAEWFRTKKRVGGTKTVNLAVVQELEPDLVIANKEENVKEQVEALAKEYPVWMTDVTNLDQALQMIQDIGALTGRKDRAMQIAKEISLGFAKLKTQNTKPKTPNPRTAYLIWRNPYMAAGGDTFINDMLLRCGFENIFSNKPRYPELEISELQAANCELLLLSSEPYPFKQKHMDELSAQLPGTRIILVDGEMFSWYGSRLLQAPVYFEQLIEALD